MNETIASNPLCADVTSTASELEALIVERGKSWLLAKAVLMIIHWIRSGKCNCVLQ
jgi:hypothetical protein